MLCVSYLVRIFHHTSFCIGHIYRARYSVACLTDTVCLLYAFLTKSQKIEINVFASASNIVDCFWFKAVYKCSIYDNFNWQICVFNENIIYFVVAGVEIYTLISMS